MSKTFQFTAKAKANPERAFVSIGDAAICVSKAGEKNRYWLHQVSKRDDDGNIVDSRPVCLIPEVDSQFAKSYGGTNKTTLQDMCREALAAVSGVPESAVTTPAGTFNDTRPPV